MTDRRKGGRNPKLDPAVNRYSLQFGRIFVPLRHCPGVFWF